MGVAGIGAQKYFYFYLYAILNRMYIIYFLEWEHTRMCVKSLW